MAQQIKITQTSNADMNIGVQKTFTAVEWLLKKIENKNGKEFSSYYTEFIEQAKAMEKEQMYQVWETSEDWSDGKLLDSKKSFEEYYKETYNK
jgi:hypothetical protein